MKHAKSKGNSWADHYTQKAKKERYPARSVYKLKEIQAKYGLIRPGQQILDLGCAPGAWTLFAAQTTGKNGLVVGIDLNPVTIDLPPQARTYVADIQALPADLGDIAAGGEVFSGFHVVLSDMAPKTTGNKHVDAARSMGLCEAALAVAQEHLVPGGAFVCKIFQGQDFKTFSDAVKAAFEWHKIFKPQSSRKASKEIFIIATGKL